MAAKDAYHDAVRNALEKDGWIITDDPYRLRVGEVDMYIDLAAEQLIAAQKENKQIAVEIKRFLSPSAITDFHKAVGQFMNYRRGLAKNDPERVLFLAVPDETYREFFVLPFIAESIEDYEIQLIIYNPESEVIVEWTS